MRGVISYIFIFAFFALPVVFGINYLKKDKALRPKWGLYFLASIVLCYFCVVISVWAIGWHYEHELYKYDLDGDRMFSGEELTKEMEEAMKRLTNDTGRSFAPITGAIMSPIYNCFWLSFFSIFVFIRRLIISKREKRVSPNF